MTTPTRHKQKGPPELTDGQFPPPRMGGIEWRVTSLRLNPKARRSNGNRDEGEDQKDRFAKPIGGHHEATFTRETSPRSR